MMEQEFTKAERAWIDYMAEGEISLKANKVMLPDQDGVMHWCIMVMIQKSLDEIRIIYRRCDNFDSDDANYDFCFTKSP